MKLKIEKKTNISYHLISHTDEFEFEFDFDFTSRVKKRFDSNRIVEKRKTCCNFIIYESNEKH